MQPLVEQRSYISTTATRNADSATPTGIFDSAFYLTIECRLGDSIFIPSCGKYSTMSSGSFRPPDGIGAMPKGIEQVKGLHPQPFVLTSQAQLPLLSYRSNMLSKTRLAADMEEKRKFRRSPRSLLNECYEMGEAHFLVTVVMQRPCEDVNTDRRQPVCIQFPA